MNEEHLKGKSVTVVYTITDPTEWRKTNPLNYAHNGLEAVQVSCGDLHGKCDRYEQALRQIKSTTTDNMACEIAVDALEKDGVK
jgi:hypothetical protein